MLPSLIRRPWSGAVTRSLREWEHEIDALLEGFFGPRGGETGETDWIPSLEGETREGNLVVRCDLPGIDPKDVKVTLEGTTLVISGERRAEEREEKNGYRFSEMRYGRFERRLTVPEGLDPEKVGARYANGVLEIMVPLPAAAAPRRVPVRIDAPRAA